MWIRHLIDDVQKQRVEESQSDGNDTNPETGKRCPGHVQGHTNHSVFGGGVGSLTDLAEPISTRRVAYERGSFAQFVFKHLPNLDF